MFTFHKTVLTVNRKQLWIYPAKLLPKANLQRSTHMLNARLITSHQLISVQLKNI